MARILFDLDGTLVHSVPTMAAAGNALLAELDRPAVPVETYAGFVGHGIAVLVERVLNHSGGVPGGAVGPHLARYRALYDADPVTGTLPYAGVQAALEALAAAGHALGVCTQKADAPAEALLRGLGLMPPIAALTGGESLPGVLKPDPRMVAHTAAQLPEGPILFVGDSETDAATARAAGVPFLWHRSGYWNASHQPDPSPAASFTDFAELPGLVARLLSPPAGV